MSHNAHRRAVTRTRARARGLGVCHQRVHSVSPSPARLSPLPSLPLSSRRPVPFPTDASRAAHSGRARRAHARPRLARRWLLLADGAAYQSARSMVLRRLLGAMSPVASWSRPARRLDTPGGTVTREQAVRDQDRPDSPLALCHAKAPPQSIIASRTCLARLRATTAYRLRRSSCMAYSSGYSRCATTLFAALTIPEATALDRRANRTTRHTR